MDVEAIRPELKLGVRVLYGAHAGSSVPIRGQLALRMMQAKEPWAVITSQMNVEDVEEGLFEPEG